MHKKYLQYFRQLKAQDKGKFRLKDYKTDIKVKPVDKLEGELLLKEGIHKLSQIQEKLYANNHYSVLIIFQATDAAGKDGAIKHVMSGLNPQGVKVHSFKTPSSEELDHDYFWRHYKALPARGEIGIFNRSHYENVLITKVHPEYILNEKLPGIFSVKDIDKKFWDKRYEQINRFEKNLAENGTVIIKFFLHLSKDEQKKRFLERIDDQSKNWKFSKADVTERKFWNDYQKAYDDMIRNTHSKDAPWYVIPADDKWFARLAIAGIICDELANLPIDFPRLKPSEKAELGKVRNQLIKD